MKANRQLHDAIADLLTEWQVANEGVEFNSADAEDRYDETLVVMNEDWNIEVMYCKDHVLIQTNGQQLPGLTAWFWIDETVHEKVASLLLEWTE
jgi:hypothetical protein